MDIPDIPVLAHSSTLNHRRKALPETFVRTVFCQMILTLDDCHSPEHRGYAVIHRDVRPANSVEWRTWVANLRGGSAEIPQGRILRSQMSDSLGLSERPFTPFSSGINSRQTCILDSTTL
jgi:hypothetical protein